MVSRASERSVGVPDAEEKWGDAATHRHRGRNSPLTFWPLFADVSKKLMPYFRARSAPSCVDTTRWGSQSSLLPTRILLIESPAWFWMVVIHWSTDRNVSLLVTS